MSPDSQRGYVRDLPLYPVPFYRAVWSAVFAAAVTTLAPALGAQALDPTMPLPPGASREKGAETSDGSSGRWVQVYRSSAPVEMLLGWYQRKMTPGIDIALDTVDLEPGEVTLTSSHVTEHSFDDECADTAASVLPAFGSNPPCKKWRRGVDKRRALQNSRLGIREGVWIDHFTITWYSRESNGDLVRRQIVVRDAGLTSNWQHDQLRSQVTLERVRRPTPPAAPAAPAAAPVESTPPANSAAPVDRAAPADTTPR